MNGTLSRREMMMGSAALAALAGLSMPGIARAAVAARVGDFLPVGGPVLAPELMPQVVRVRRDLEPGSIIVLSDRFHLYHITGPGVAVRYGVAVGRAELKFRGTAEIARKVEWPSWKPTPEMIERSPGHYAKYADGMPGGPNNPLGARALYLYQNGHDTAIRIHGTVEPQSIGSAVSNGCIRMVNEHVIDLYSRVAIGTPVTVF